MKEAFYFVDILPSDTIQEEVTQFKDYAATHFESSHALNSPPHVTLVPPFRWADTQVNQVTAVLKDFAKVQNPFHLRLQNFNCFRPRVIFVNVVPCQALTDLHRALSTTVESLLQIQTDLDRPYHPHMSVAFRDLSRLHFAKAWEYYSQLSYEREFALKEIYLLRHNGREWEEYGMFKFTGNPN